VEGGLTAAAPARETIAWVINRFDTVGGGERVINEGARHLRAMGHRVLIVTWHYDESVLFNGHYEARDIINLGAEEVPRGKIFARAWSRFRSLGRLRAILKREGVRLVFVQGEYDVALAYLLTRFTGIRYRFLIFGQMFQYPHDHGKYARPFRRHLRTIVESQPGYRETIPLKQPPITLANRLANEVIALVRRRAVRRAERTFAFSAQVQWETRLLFGVSPQRAAGAFRRLLLDAAPATAFDRARYGIPDGPYLLSLSRLDRKKRIDVVIRAFAQAELPQDVALVIAGSGPDEPLLRQVAAEQNTARRIIFAGRVAEDDLLPMKAAASLFVSMDIGDFDISPLEAMALGVPALCATEFDAEPQLRNNPGFRLVEAEKDALARELTACLTHPLVVDRAALMPYSWENYFETLAARDESS
jgi:glycosyltransferase involved in cell wall biosynthesis